MIKDLIKLANELDKANLFKEADELDFIITKIANSLLPLRQHSITGERVRGCRADEDTSYCNKLRSAKSGFDYFLNSITEGTEHSKVWKYLTGKGIGSRSLQDGWFTAIMTRYIPDPDFYKENGDEVGLTITDLHESLLEVSGSEAMKGMNPHVSSPGLIGPLKDLFSSDDDRDKNPYGEFLDDLLSAIEYGARSTQKQDKEAVKPSSGIDTKDKVKSMFTVKE